LSERVRLNIVPNIYRPEYDESRDHPGFRCQRARVGRQAGCERLGLSLFEVPPGEAAYPYHYHLTEEEILLVLAGRLSLRTPDGWRELEEGEVAAFPRGEAGAHQVVNRSEEPVRFLAFSTSGEPDILVQPDSGKLGAYERRPSGEGLRAWFRTSDAVDYYDGEHPPRRFAVSAQSTRATGSTQRRPGNTTGTPGCLALHASAGACARRAIVA
jgi:uncharacterized cupin superfamily protein